MAATVNSDDRSTIDFSDFCEYIDKTYKILNYESLVELAPLFKQLGNNKSFLEDIIIAGLKGISEEKEFQQNNPYSAQCMCLHHAPGKFFIRSNVWLPQNLLNKINGAGEEQLFAYHNAHDHNFDFMTIGYLGSGYSTDIYEYDYEKAQGFVGEKVDIRHLETTDLREGKIMIYRSSKDIHSQKFPKEFSISLNLMAPVSHPIKNQYMFDLETKTIKDFVHSSFLGRKLLLEAAALIPNGNVYDVLDSIAKSHICAQTRKVALQSLSRK